MLTTWKSVSELLICTSVLFLSPCQLSSLHIAARGGDLCKVEELVRKGADVNDKDIRSGVRIVDCMYLVSIVNLGFSFRHPSKKSCPV